MRLQKRRDADAHHTRAGWPCGKRCFCTAARMHRMRLKATHNSAADDAMRHCVQKRRANRARVMRSIYTRCVGLARSRRRKADVSAPPAYTPTRPVHLSRYYFQLPLLMFHELKLPSVTTPPSLARTGGSSRSTTTRGGASRCDKILFA